MASQGYSALTVRHARFKRVIAESDADAVCSRVIGVDEKTTVTGGT
jgi:hypothetical protein